jgi:hypothetical protein
MKHADIGSSDAAPGEVFERLLNFLNRLDEAHTFYALGHTRADSVMVTAVVPGWHWEVEFVADRSVEVERYESAAGVQSDPQLLEALFSGADPA